MARRRSGPSLRRRCHTFSTATVLTVAVWLAAGARVRQRRSRPAAGGCRSNASRSSRARRLLPSARPLPFVTDGDGDADADADDAPLVTRNGGAPCGQASSSAAASTAASTSAVPAPPLFQSFIVAGVAPACSPARAARARRRRSTPAAGRGRGGARPARRWRPRRVPEYAAFCFPDGAASRSCLFEDLDAQLVSLLAPLGATVGHRQPQAAAGTGGGDALASAAAARARRRCRHARDARRRLDRGRMGQCVGGRGRRLVLRARHLLRRPERRAARGGGRRGDPPRRR